MGKGIAVSSQLAYMTTMADRGLHIVDVSDPTKPTYLRVSYTTPAEDVALMGNYALVAAGDTGLVIYEVQQHIYPPLLAPVVSAGTVTLTWGTPSSVRLQKAAHLTSPTWEDVAGSEGTNTVSLPMTEATAFFRLVKP